MYKENSGEIVVYQPDEVTRLEVRVEGETVWLNRHQLATLFDRDVKTIGKHIKNALREELENLAVVANFATTAADGKTYYVEHYNLDMVLSIGYRVKSSRGVQFRKWANTILKEFLLKGCLICDRMSILENQVNRKLVEHERRLDEYGEKIDFFVRTSLPPVEGVFYDGQIFDAYVFASDLIRLAQRRVVLIDNYVDESVLVLLSKRGAGVFADIRTGRLPQQFMLDLDRHNSQYPPVAVVQTQNIHDRFLVVDDTVYHIGASLKDLGKKLFAFSKMGISPEMLIR